MAPELEASGRGKRGAGAPGAVGVGMLGDLRPRWLQSHGAALGGRWRGSAA